MTMVKKITNKPSIRPGPWCDNTDNSVLHVVGVALDERDMKWLILWREEDVTHSTAWIFAKAIADWRVRMDNGKARYTPVDDK